MPSKFENTKILIDTVNPFTCKPELAEVYNAVERRGGLLMLTSEPTEGYVIQYIDRYELVPRDEMNEWIEHDKRSNDIVYFADNEIIRTPGGDNNA